MSIEVLEGIYSGIYLKTHEIYNVDLVGGDTTSLSGFGNKLTAIGKARGKENSPPISGAKEK